MGKEAAACGPRSRTGWAPGRGAVRGAGAGAGAKDAVAGRTPADRKGATFPRRPRSIVGEEPYAGFASRKTFEKMIWSTNA
jgi:hypothetical protein